MSMSSTGSSPPSSASPDGSPTQISRTRHLSGGGGRGETRFEFSLTSQQAASGEIDSAVAPARYIHRFIAVSARQPTSVLGLLSQS